MQNDVYILVGKKHPEYLRKDTQEAGNSGCPRERNWLAGGQG